MLDHYNPILLNKIIYLSFYSLLYNLNNKIKTQYKLLKISNNSYT